MDEKLFMIFEWRSFHMSSVVGICSASRTGLYLKQQENFPEYKSLIHLLWCLWLAICNIKQFNFKQAT